MDYTYTQAKEIINEFGRFTIEKYEHYGMTIIDTESGEYAIGTEEEANDAWQDSLESYLDEIIYPELPENLVNYFDDDKWLRDASYDGRGHSLSPYDGCEINIICGLVAFRLN